ncbi:SAF domain-containing protein [Promicromonospora sp. NPDC023987]|uniref:SAF domain-containing protein n=1 Tax=Promicromonospora sp. NPDC023987 TaxID=3155360 RepID=UPI0033FB2907
MRRQPWLAVLAGAALAAGGVLGLITWMVMSTSQDVVVAAHDLDAFDVLSADDVRVVSVTLDPSVAAIPGEDAAALIGQRLTGAVETGAVLAPGQVSEDAFPPEGQSVVRVTLTPDQSGELALVPGDAVRVVVSAATAQSDAEPTYTSAQVAAVRVGTSRTVVEVLVPHEEAVALSDAVVAGRASLVQDSGVPVETAAGGE